MTIIYIVDSLQTGGAEKSIVEMASRLKSIKPVLVVVHADKDDLRKTVADLGIRIIDLHISRSERFWFVKGKNTFESICQELQPELIHAHLYKSSIIARISRLPAKTSLVGAFVADSYSAERYRSAGMMGRFKLNVVRFFDRITIRRCDAMTSITDTIARSNAKNLNYPAEKIYTIHRGRDTDLFVPVDKGIQKSAPYHFLAVGRLYPSKRYVDMIDAVSLLVSRGQKAFDLSIAGNGVDMERLRSRIRDKGVEAFIHLLGTRNDVPALLQQADCFIMASLYEGQGGALVEAMLSGLPVICSDIEVFREQVTNQVTARLFTVQNPESLADQMEWMMGHREESLLMGQKARESACSRFDIARIAEKTESFYLRMIKEKAAG